VTSSTNSKSKPLAIAWLEVADTPELWRSFGFEVSTAGACVVGGVEIRLIGDSEIDRGIVGWTLVGAGVPSSIDGIRTSMVTSHETPAEGAHGNGVFRIDHLVVSSSSTPRTVAAFNQAGLQRRGHRDTNSEGTSVDMTFFWIGDQLVELAGPPVPDENGRPARFSGIAFSSEDLDQTVALLGELSTVPREAVQPGRHICALHKEAGSSVPMAFMTPHVKR
jgi:hypothetical protein